MCAAATGSADRGFTWSDEETGALLRFWGAKDAQNDSAGNKRNYVVYEKIAEKMASLGFNRSTSQCREKIKRMKREYTLTKQFNGTTSGPKKLMRFYDQFEKILIEKQNQNQRNTTLRLVREYVPASSTESQAAHFNKRKDSFVRASSTHLRPFPDVPPHSVENWTGSEDLQSMEIPDPDKDEVADPWAPAVVLIEGDEAASSSFHGSHSNISTAASCSGERPPRKKKKKKMASRMVMFQSMMEAVTAKFVEYQESADARFLAQMESLEQDRRASEENIQKMWMDFEEKRRKEEQDHELKVISTFRDIIGQISSKKVPPEKT